jgi:hypothetical protein
MNILHAVAIAALLSASCVSTSSAQHVSPSGARAVDGGTPLPSFLDTIPGVRHDAAEQLPKRAQTLVGGAVGGVGGALLGMAIARQTSKGCSGDFCSIGASFLGFALGESIGLAVGAHLGSGSSGSEKIVATTLSSLGILAGSTFAAVGLSRAGMGGIMIPLTPALQLGAALLIESH